MPRYPTTRRIAVALARLLTLVVLALVTVIVGACSGWYRITYEGRCRGDSVDVSRDTSALIPCSFYDPPRTP